MEKLYTVRKKEDLELTVAQIIISLQQNSSLNQKVGKTTRPIRYDLNQIPYDYTVEVKNRFKGLDLVYWVPEELQTEVCNTVQEALTKTIPKKKKHKKAKWLWRRLLRVSWTMRRPNQSILKEINPEYSLEGLMLKLSEAPVLWPPNVKSWLFGKDPDAGKDWRKEEKGAIRWLDSITESMDMNLSELLEIMEDMEAWCATVHRITKSQTRLSDWTTKNITLAVCQGEVDGSCKENCSITVLPPSNNLHPSGAPTPSANRETHAWMKPKFPTTYIGPSINGVPPVSCSSQNIPSSHLPQVISRLFVHFANLFPALRALRLQFICPGSPFLDFSSPCTLRSPLKRRQRHLPLLRWLHFGTSCPKDGPL